jgi:hypothetical protein
MGAGVSDLWSFVVLFGVIAFCLIYTRDDTGPRKHVENRRTEPQTPNVREDGSTVGQMRGFAPASEGPKGTHQLSDRVGWPEAQD